MPRQNYRLRLWDALREPAQLGLWALLGAAWAWDVMTLHWHVRASGAGVAALEAIWLLVAPVLPRYQALQRRREGDRFVRAREAEIRRQLSLLTPELALRYETVRRLGSSIQAEARQAGAVAADLLAEELDKLEALLAAFLRLLSASQRYRQYLDRTDEGSILKDIEHLRGTLHRMADPDTRRILQQNLDILDKRRERFVAIQRGYLNVQAQLDVIEDTFHLIDDQMVSLRAPDNVRTDLDQIISGVEITEEVLLETSALIAEQIS